MIEIDTTNILFIVGGAFAGLEDIIKTRVGERLIGFGSSNEKNDVEDSKNITQHLLPDDLQKFGLIPEFIGRLPVIAVLNELEEDDLVNILTKPKNSLVKQYQTLLHLDNVDLEFDEGALGAIGSRAISQGTGARGLRTIIEEIMLNVMFEVPSRDDITKVIITEDTVRDKKEPIYYDEEGNKIS